MASSGREMKEARQGRGGGRSTVGQQAVFSKSEVKEKERKGNALKR